jgi:hypothetical protein
MALLPNKKQLLPLDLIRLQNMISPSPINPIMGDFEGSNDEGSDENTVPLSDPVSTIRQNQPSNEAETQLRAMLGQMPQRNRPGLGRRIMSGMVALGVNEDPRYLELSRQVADPKYYQEMADWNEKLDPLKALATTEGSRRNTERLIASDESRFRIAQQNADTAQQRAIDQARNAEEDRKIKRARIDLENWIAKNPNQVIKINEEGELIGIHPKTLVETPILDTEGDPVKGNQVTPAQAQKYAIERIDRTAAGAMARVKAAGDIRATAAGKKHDWDVELANLRSRNQITLKTTPSGNALAGKAPSFSQRKYEILQRTNEIISRYPELKDYYTISDKGDVSVVEEGDDPDLRALAVQRLFDVQKDTQLIPDKGTESSASPNSKPEVNPYDDSGTSPVAPPVAKPTAPAAKPTTTATPEAPIPGVTKKTFPNGKVGTYVRLPDGRYGWAVKK